MIAKCSSCGNDDLNPADGYCKNCLQPFENPAAPPQQLIPAEEAAGQPDQPPIDEPSSMRTLIEASRQLDGAQTAQEKQNAWETWEKAVFDYHDQKFRIITLIGFSTAGKTFFANRLRRELRLRDRWNVDPREQETIVKTTAKIDWTQLVRHGKWNRRLRVLADCDGEAYRQSIESVLKEESLPDNFRRYVLITALASAYILMVPAARGIGLEDDNLADRFDVIVNAILSLQRRLRETGDAQRVVKEGLQREQLRKALQLEFHCDRPILVLFAQADKVPNIQDHESDPLAYAMMHAKTLYRTIDNHFTNYRFDFVSAFCGHDDSRALSYDLQHHGALDAFDWVDDMVEHPRLWRYRTAAATRARWLFDSQFRRDRKLAAR